MERVMGMTTMDGGVDTKSKCRGSMDAEERLVEILAIQEQ